MKKTLFKKYLRITTAVILLSFFIISVVIMLFVTSYWKSEKRSLLQKSAQSVAELTAESVMQMDSDSYFLLNGGRLRMQRFVAAFAKNIESDIFVTNTDGELILIAYGSSGDSANATKPVSGDIMQKVLRGHYTAEGNMNGIYKNTYYIEGLPIVLRGAGKSDMVIGAVFAAYNTETFTAFRWTIVKVLLGALLAAFVISFAVVWLFTTGSCSRCGRWLQRQTASAEATSPSACRLPRTTKSASSPLRSTTWRIPSLRARLPAGASSRTFRMS